MLWFAGRVDGVKGSLEFQHDPQALLQLPGGLGQRLVAGPSRAVLPPLRSIAYRSGTDTGHVGVEKQHPLWSPLMTIADLHNCFASYLPRMQSVAKYHFRHADAERRDEAVQNTVCLV